MYNIILYIYIYQCKNQWVILTKHGLSVLHLLLAHTSQQNADKKSSDPFLHLPLLNDSNCFHIVSFSNHNYTAVHNLNFTVQKKHMNYVKVSHVLRVNDTKYRKQYCAYRSILQKQSLSCNNGTRCTN